MSIIPLLFYVFSAMALASATLVIVSRNPVQAVLFLILTFFSMAGIWMLLEAEFLAITLVLVYVGAVMVLFLFVVMMLNVEEAALASGFTRYLPLGVCVSVLVLVSLAYALGKEPLGFNKVFDLPSQAAGTSQVKRLGELLYTQYLYPFEIAGVLLFVAIVAAISLTFRGRRAKKTPYPSDQMKQVKTDRLKLINLKSEKAL